MGQSTIAREQLRSIVERIERLEAEKKNIAEDIRDVFAEAKGNGYDVKVLREIIKLRKQEAHERSEHEAVLDLYKHALGMLPAYGVDDEDDLVNKHKSSSQPTATQKQEAQPAL